VLYLLLSKLSEPVARRDAERSRQAVLDAAQALFAELGYESVSMERIGRRAGLSRGAPGYFFGSKEALYKAVLERMFMDIERLVDATRQQLKMLGTDELDRALEIVVGNLLAFLFHHPTYIVLVERETLRGSGVMRGTRGHLSLLRCATAIAEDFGPVSADPSQILLSLLGLCWFPLANPALVRDLGNQFDPRFLEARKRHVVELLRDGLRA
jgi:TetR/AcrR family transcriptional regulator